MSSLIKTGNKTAAIKTKERTRNRGRENKNGASPISSRGPVARTPHSPLAPTNLSLTAVVDKSTSKEAVSGSLRKTPHYSNTAEMAEKIGSLVARDFRYDDQEEETLISQFSTFFGMLGWTCEDNMAAIADDPFPRPESLGAKPEAVSMINPAMILYLQALSAYVKTVRNDVLYIYPSTTYNQLAVYNAKHQNSG